MMFAATMVAKFFVVAHHRVKTTYRVGIKFTQPIVVYHPLFDHIIYISFAVPNVVDTGMTDRAVCSFPPSFFSGSIYNM